MRTHRSTSPLRAAAVRPVALTLAVLAPLALTACGGASGPATGRGDSGSARATATAPAAAPASDAGPALISSRSVEPADAPPVATPGATPGVPADATTDAVRDAEGRYIHALHERDASAVCAMVTGWRDVPGGRVLSCRTAFGRIIARSPRFPVVSRRTLDAMRVEVDGATATITDPLGGLPTHYRKVGATWRLDIVAMR